MSQNCIGAMQSLSSLQAFYKIKMRKDMIKQVLTSSVGAVVVVFLLPFVVLFSDFIKTARTVPLVGTSLSALTRHKQTNVNSNLIVS